MPIPPILHAPLHRVVAHHAWSSRLTAVRDVVSVVVRQRAVAALAVVDDAIGVAVGGPFDDRAGFNGEVAVVIVPVTNTIFRHCPATQRKVILTAAFAGGRV